MQEEQINENIDENKPKRHYKIEAGDVVTIYRNDFGEYTFYKVSIPKKAKDGSKTYFSKNVAFRKGTDIKDKTKIKINDFYEDVYARSGDKYNANWTLFISEYEIVGEDASFAIDQYHQEISENNNIEISPDDLPF